MKTYHSLSENEKEHLLKMLLAGPMDFDAFPNKVLNISYGSHPQQIMNLYLPETGEGPFPVIFFLHGGGWQGGSPDDTQVMPFIPGLKRGFAVVSCGYRLMPEAYFPDNLSDVKKALTFISTQADRYHLDQEKFILAGASAGAHLALMAGFTENVPSYFSFETPLPKIIGIIDQFGPTDFANEEKHFEESGYARMNPPSEPGQAICDRLLQTDTTKNPSLLRFLSPVYSVHSNIPPVLILHGRYDSMVPYQQSEELYETICRICEPERARFVLSEETTHADTAYEKEPYTSIIFNFIESLLI